MHLHSQVKTSPTCIPCKPRASPTFQRTSSPSWPTPPRWTRWTSMRTPPSTTHPSTTMALQVQSNVHLIWKMAAESLFGTVLTNFDFQASPDRACWTKREPRDQISTAMVSLISGLLASGRVNIVWHHLGEREEIKRPRWYGSVGSIHAEVMAVPRINLNIFFMIMASPSKEAMAAILWKFSLL